ncbi:MAG: helix-turn-helix domain-containing protein [Nitrososphaeraceae archaeon]
MDSDNYNQEQPIDKPLCKLHETKSNEMQKSHIPMQKRWIYYIEERRKEVAQMLAQGHTETEIAQLLHVHVSTICRDVKVLKELSQRFVFDLAKGDLTYYYKQCIDGIDEIRREAWSLYKYGDWSQGVHLTVKEKLAALKLLKECNEAKFALLEKGPAVLNVKGMEERLSNIPNRQALTLPL